MTSEQLYNNFAHAWTVCTEAFDDAGGDPLALLNDAEQEVLGADVTVSERLRLAKRELENLLCPRREWRTRTTCRLCACLSDFRLDPFADVVERDAKRLEGLCGDTRAFVHKSAEDVLGADETVTEEARLFLCKHEHATRPIG